MSDEIWLTLTDSERRIWEAAYAAAFVAEFRAEASVIRFGAAILNDHAERAMTIADAAVAQLRRWREEGAYPTSRARGAPKRVDGQWVRTEEKP